VIFIFKVEKIKKRPLGSSDIHMVDLSDDSGCIYKCCSFDFSIRYGNTINYNRPVQIAYRGNFCAVLKDYT
jgi:hypothetical protein